MPQLSISPYLRALAADLQQTADGLDTGVLALPQAEDRVRAITAALETLEAQAESPSILGSLGGFMDVLEQQVQAFAQFRQQDDASVMGTLA